MPDVRYVVYAKCDLLERHQPVDDSFIRSSPFAAWPRFQARADIPASLVAPIDWVFEQPLSIPVRP